MVSNETLHKLFRAFPNAIINRNLEFVADPNRRVNSYFRNEEIGDILLCLETLGLPVEARAYRNEMDAKLERWVRRMKGESQEA